MRTLNLELGPLLLPWQVADPGEMIAGRYQIERLVNADIQGNQCKAHSSQALVYKARGIDGRDYCLKQLVAAGEAKRIRQFEAEAEFLLHRAQGHPHVVRALECTHSFGERFLVMEWLAGESAFALVHRQGPLPADAVRDFLLTGARVLHVVHAGRQVHRDVSENNCFRTANGWIWFDFGGITDTTPRQTTFGGTALIPEIELALKNGHPVPFTAASDIYALCSAAYFAATGIYPPDDRRTFPSITPIGQLRPGFDNIVDQAIQHGLSVDPAARFRSAAELVRLLAPVQPVVPVPPRVVPRRVPLQPSPVSPVRNLPPPPQPVTQRNGFQAVGFVCLASAAIAIAFLVTAFATGVTKPGPRVTTESVPATAPAISVPAQVQGPALSDPSGRYVERAPAQSPGTTSAHPVRRNAPALQPPPLNRIVRVWGEDVRVRSAPSLEASVLTHLVEPETVHVVGWTSGWYRVELDGASGYVWGAYLLHPRHRRAVLLQHVQIDGQVLPAWTKVLITAGSGGTVQFILPDYSSARVASAAVLFKDVTHGSNRPTP